MVGGYTDASTICKDRECIVYSRGVAQYNYLHVHIQAHTYVTYIASAYYKCKFSFCVAYIIGNPYVRVLYTTCMHGIALLLIWPV